MVEKIRAGNSSEFTYIKQFEKNGKTIHAALSGPMANYFFQDGRRDIWISVPAQLSMKVLDDFLVKL